RRPRTRARRCGRAGRAARRLPLARAVGALARGHSDAAGDLLPRARTLAEPLPARDREPAAAPARLPAHALRTPVVPAPRVRVRRRRALRPRADAQGV